MNLKSTPDSVPISIFALWFRCDFRSLYLFRCIRCRSTTVVERRSRQRKQSWNSLRP